MSILAFRISLFALAAGFVNPYASGYAMDIFFVWSVLAAWILHEAKVKGIRNESCPFYRGKITLMPRALYGRD